MYIWGKRLIVISLKKYFFLLVLCSTSLLFAQEKKYQSLLWEISGNGLQKKSYVYGSMHVSDKISYHLSDAFFTHLQKADIVANESEPRTWTSLFDMFSFVLSTFIVQQLFICFEGDYWNLQIAEEFFNETGN